MMPDRILPVSDDCRQGRHFLIAFLNRFSGL